MASDTLDHRVLHPSITQVINQRVAVQGAVMVSFVM